MPEPILHLIKLSVGTGSVDDLAEWQSRRSRERAAAGGDPRPCHVTRVMPRRADELTRGGSIYWVIRGLVQARQGIAALEHRVGEDGIARCAIILEPELIRTRPQPRRPFQGWRYLRAEDAPRDLDGLDGDALPAELARELAEIGVL